MSRLALSGQLLSGREALLAGAGAAAAVADPVGAGAVPGHPDHQRAVVAVVGGPPVLRGRQHLGDVLLDRVEVEGLELRRVVEVVAHRVGLGGVLGEDPEVEPVRPPAGVAAALGRVGRALGVERAAAVLLLVHLADYGIGRVSDMGDPFGWSVGLVGGARGRAVGAEAPVDDLGLVDREAVIVGRGQTGCVADGAIDVGDRAARRGRRCGGGCRRPATRSGRPSRAAGCAAPARRRSAPAARRRRPGGRRRRGRRGRSR